MEIIIYHTCNIHMNYDVKYMNIIFNILFVYFFRKSELITTHYATFTHYITCDIEIYYITIIS